LCWVGLCCAVLYLLCCYVLCYVLLCCSAEMIFDIS
jgi:hypothetical protein